VAVTFDLVAYHHVVHADDILEDEISMRIVRVRLAPAARETGRSRANATAGSPERYSQPCAHFRPRRLIGNGRSWKVGGPGGA
jgi:hypothetical protein